MYTSQQTLNWVFIFLLKCWVVQLLIGCKYLFLLSFRNNLTVVDFLLVQGQGTYESLKMAGKPPGPGSSLRFKLTEALLRDCSDSEYERSQEKRPGALRASAGSPAYT